MGLPCAVLAKGAVHGQALLLEVDEAAAGEKGPNLQGAGLGFRVLQLIQWAQIYRQQGLPRMVGQSVECVCCCSPCDSLDQVMHQLEVFSEPRRFLAGRHSVASLHGQKVFRQAHCHPHGNGSVLKNPGPPAGWKYVDKLLDNDLLSHTGHGV